MKTLRSMLAGMLLYTGTMLPPGQAAARSIPADLPEQRYTQQDVVIKHVLDKRYDIPILHDSWTDVLDQKVTRLKRVMRGSDDCERLTIDSEGIKCETADYICTNYDYKDNWCKNNPWNDKSCERECLSGKYDNWETEFSISYGQMRRIRQSTSFLNDDNVEFNDKEKKYSIDTANSGVAVRAVELLQDIVDITNAMEKDDDKNDNKGRILPANSLFPNADVSALKHYEAARERLTVQDVSRNAGADCIVNAFFVVDEYGRRQDEDSGDKFSGMGKCLFDRGNNYNNNVQRKKDILQLVKLRSRDFPEKQRSELEQFVKDLVAEFNIQL